MSSGIDNKPLLHNLDCNLHFSAMSNSDVNSQVIIEMVPEKKEGVTQSSHDAVNKKYKLRRSEFFH